MVRQIVLLLAIVLGLASMSYVDACEDGCRSGPVNYLTEKYEALLDHLTYVIELDDIQTADFLREGIPEIVDRIGGRGGVIDKAIFDKFRGTCKPVGQREPEELCGSAKSIACYAPWELGQKSVLQMVHDAVTLAVKKHFPWFEAIVDYLESSCPGDCQDWVGPFQSMMLGWEKREHPEAYGDKIPNCLPLDEEGV